MVSIRVSELISVPVFPNLAVVMWLQVGQYLAYLAEEGQELAGKIKPHVTRGTQAY